ncbi:hypothetical protein Anapl_00194 [Anas platyrhynchos]|uniref:Uncharacterized protein n=1 Tax=Anas platyrhynchos TaxID=8839 RepID=R0K3C6_ANAPL|nr:hypothetical protein Anapl_00194 [Anas platyrhynchos]
MTSGTNEVRTAIGLSARQSPAQFGEGGQSTRATYGSSGHRRVADPAATSRFSTLCFETSSSVQSCSLCRQRKVFSRKLVGLLLPALSQQTPAPAIVRVGQRADGPRQAKAHVKQDMWHSISQVKSCPHSEDAQPKQQLQGWEPSYLLGYAALPWASWDLNVLLESCKMRMSAVLLTRSRVFLHPGSQAAASPGPAALTLSAVYSFSASGRTSTLSLKCHIKRLALIPAAYFFEALLVDTLLPAVYMLQHGQDPVPQCPYFEGFKLRKQKQIASVKSNLCKQKVWNAVKP